MIGESPNAVVVEYSPASDGEPSMTAPQWLRTAKGKGRLKPRKAQPASRQAAVPRLTAVSHSAAEHGEREGDPQPAYPQAIAEGWVDYIAMDSPTHVYQALEAFRANRPVLLRGHPLVAGLVGRWSFGHLARCAASAAGPSHPATIEVMCSAAQRHRFMECDSSKNGYTSHYHIREPETQRLQMGVPEFVQCAQTWHTRRVMLSARVMAQQPPALEAQVTSNPAQQDVPGLAPGPVGGALADDLRSGVDWAWLAGLRRSQGFGPVMGVDLEAATAGAVQPARYAEHDELMVQVAGRRRVLLVPPQFAFAGMYPYPTGHPYDRYSMAEWAGGEAGGARVQEVRGKVCVLCPGDALHVPAFWFVHTQDLEAESLVLRVALHPGTRAPAADAAALRLSRALEERVGDVEGPRRVRWWLQLIGRGAEGPHLDLSTVAGYRRIVMCQGVRDEVEETLGAGEWARLLPAMCEGRLMPTPWLNRTFREPLLLADRPTILEDTRSDEERKYPSLFRRKLEAEGWTVAPSKSTVPIPGVNMPLHGDYRAP